MTDTVLFDGHCNFCATSIETLKRLGGNNKRLRFLSLHDPQVAIEYPDLTHEQLMKEMWVVSHDGRKFAGIDSIRYLSLRLPGLYPLAPFLHIPFARGFWRVLYRFVARNRYRIAGSRCDSGTCQLHRR
jgi:predicted DCC family thiol-disulfide oxidoreductase YuxK